MEVVDVALAGVEVMNDLDVDVLEVLEVLEVLDSVEITESVKIFNSFCSATASEVNIFHQEFDHFDTGQYII